MGLLPIGFVGADACARVVPSLSPSESLLLTLDTGIGMLVLVELEIGDIYVL